MASKLAARAVIKLFPTLGTLEQGGIWMVVYVAMLGCDLYLLAKVPFRRAITIATIFGLCGVAVSMLILPLVTPQPQPQERATATP